MKRTTFLALAALFLLAALPAAAAQAPPVQAPAASPATLAACAHALSALDLAPAATQAAVLPAWLATTTAQSTTKYRGFCACGCSFVPDCNTNADCSNNLCLQAITCC